MAAGALGFQFRGRGEPGQQLLDYLREKQMLILFDNFEHVLDGRSLLLEILKRAPKVSILVTSRESLRLTGEKIYWLDPLLVHDDGKTPGDELPDGVALFTERASLVKHDFEVTAESLSLVQTICEKLDGVPLAIELAAAWSDFYPLPQILKSVEHQLDITARMADMHERHRSVRACLDHSYKLLNDEQAQALRALAVFAGSFSLEAATRILAEPETAELLSDLHAKSWIYACPRGDEARFCMRQAQREYADEQLAKDEHRNTYLDRHAEYFAQFVEMKCEELVGPSQLKAVTAINADLPNVYAALQFSIDERVLKLLSCFSKHLRCYLEYVSCYPQGEAHYLKMQAVLGQLPNGDGLKRVRMYIHLGLGIFLWRLGKAKEAQVEYASARKLAEELLDASTLAQSVSAIANFNIRGGKYTKAEELQRQAIEIWHKHGEASGLSHSYSGLGAALFFQGRLDEAEECYRTSLSMARDSGDLRGISRALNNLGLLLSRRGGLDEANSLFQESIKISRQIGATDMVSLAINNLGNIALNEGDLEKARKWYSESLNFSREIGHLYEATGALNNLGELCCKEGKHEEARVFILQSLALAEGLAEPIVRVEAIIRAALLLRSMGKKDDAFVLLKQAIHAADALGVAVNPHSREEADALLNEMSEDEETAAALPEVTPAYLTEIVRKAREFLQSERES
jgi:predicted ATPase/Tfp pilus assembly protein PilF